MSARPPFPTVPPVAALAAITPRGSNRSYWLMLQRAALAAALVHAAFSMLFFVLGAPLMGWANIGSVALYIGVQALLKARQNQRATVLMWVELLLHALVATWVLGWDSGFHYYVLLMVPMVFVSPGRGLRGKLVLGTALAAYYMGLDIYARHHPPLSVIHAVGLDSVRYFNIATTLMLLAYLAHVYLRTVQRAERRLHDLATTDALTGLANRRQVQQVAASQLNHGKPEGTGLCFILGDVDHFKSINDHHGHEAGDQVLVAVAEALRGAIRDTDTVGRWGGEEFLIVLPGTALPAAMQVAERVREAVGRLAVSHGSATIQMSVTLGVSQVRGDEAIEAAIARADAAMYEGKLSGRNRSVAAAMASVADTPA